MGRLIICCLGFVCLVCCSEVKKTYNGYKLIQALAKNKDHVTKLEMLEQEEWLLNKIDFWKRPSLNAGVDMLLAPDIVEMFTDKLKEYQIPYRVLQEDIGKLLEAENARERRQLILPNRWCYYPKNHSYYKFCNVKSSTGGSAGGSTSRDVVGKYARHSQINSWLDSQATQYSSIASTQSIGKSYEGKEMKVIKIGTRKSTKKPIIWIDAGIHAREWIAPATLIWIINKLLQGSQNDRTIKALIDKYDWIMLPCANPDGYEFSHTVDRFWRKTRSPGNIGSVNCIGVDPNRNFDDHFGESGVSRNPCSLTYPGTKAFSEIETNNMAKFILKNSKDILMYMSFHAYSQLWLTPWGYTKTPPRDGALLDRIALAGAKALKQINGKYFKVGSPAKILYAASGGSFDWAKSKAGIKYSYTLELRPDSSTGRVNAGFVLPSSEIQPSGEEVFAGIKEVLRNIEQSGSLIG